MGRAAKLREARRHERQRARRDGAMTKTYLADSGQAYTHQEAPSQPWEPMRQAGTFTLGEAYEGGEVWENRWYECSVRRYPAGFPIGDSPYLVLGITHVSQQAIHDWRDMMRIKNDIAGEEWEGLELYPAESRLVDPSNRFYLWCVPKGVIGWGLNAQSRRVLTMRQSIAPQRPFPEEA